MSRTDLRIHHAFSLSTDGLKRHICPETISRRVDHVLQAVVTYTEKLALEQAAAADELLAKGIYLGDLS